MLTPKELKIIELYSRNIFASHTIRGIMKNMGTKSYNWTHTAVTKLIKEKILAAEEKGKSIICRINLDEQATLACLSYVEEARAAKANIPNIRKILPLIDQDYFTLIIAGSYAKGKAAEKSDLDVVAIVDKKDDVTPLMNRLRNRGEFMIPELHPYVFTSEEFHLMLLGKDENYGKEIFKNCLVVSGAEGYYRMLRRAVKNGFRG